MTQKIIKDAYYRSVNKRANQNAGAHGLNKAVIHCGMHHQALKTNAVLATVLEGATHGKVDHLSPHISTTTNTSAYVVD